MDLPSHMYQGGTQDGDAIMAMENSQNDVDMTEASTPLPLSPGNNNDDDDLPPPTPALDWDEIASRIHTEPIDPNENVPENMSFIVRVNIMAAHPMLIGFGTPVMAAQPSLKEAEQFCVRVAKHYREIGYDDPKTRGKDTIFSLSIHGPWSDVNAGRDIMLKDPYNAKSRMVAFLNLTQWYRKDPEPSFVRVVSKPAFAPHEEFASRFPGGVIPEEVSSVIANPQAMKTLAVKLAAIPAPEFPVRGKENDKAWERKLAEYKRAYDVWKVKATEAGATTVTKDSIDPHDPRAVRGKQHIDAAVQYASKIKFDMF